MEPSVLEIPGYNLADITDRVIDVSRRYDEPWRFYHTNDHLDVVLSFLQDNLFALEVPARVFWAALYHDAIYVPGESFNEELSARLAECNLSMWSEYHWVGSAIRRTKTHDFDLEHDDQDLAWLFDADLIGFASGWEQFDLNNRNIEQEFILKYTPEEFKVGRLKFLNEVLDRPNIFSTDYAVETFQAKAIENIVRSIEELS